MKFTLDFTQHISKSHYDPLSARCSLLFVHLALRNSSFSKWNLLILTFPWSIQQKSAGDRGKVGTKSDVSAQSFWSFSIFKVLAPIPPVPGQHPCTDGPPSDHPSHHIRALLSSSLQFTLATSGWCRTVLLLHLWASCSPGSRKYRHAPKPASTRTDTSR